MRISGSTIVVFAILLVATLFLWSISPLFQGLLIHFYIGFFNWVLIGLAASLLIWGMASSDSGSNDSGLGYLGLFGGVVIGVAATFFSLAGDGIAKSSVASSLKPELIQSIPATQRVRFVPIEVAETLARNQQEVSQLVLGDMDPIDYKGDFLWVGPRVPNGFFNSLGSSMDGFMVVDENRKLTVVSQPFRYGEGMLFANDIRWQMIQKHYFSRYPEIFYLPVEPDGRYLGVVPYISYRFEFPVMVPYWEGVMLFHDDGTIEDLTVAQATKDPRLTNQRLFPEWLARYQADAIAQYKHGIWNAWFQHRDQAEIPIVAHSVNQMPYLLPGNIWMIAAEPVGNSQSVSKIFLIDAHTGKMQIAEFSTERAMISPNVGWGYAKAGTQGGYVWAEGEGGTYLLVEPRPAIKDGKLYWMYTVTVRQATGISLTILVGSNTEVLHFCSRESLMQWVQGTGGTEKIPCGEQRTDSPAPTPDQGTIPSTDIRKMSDQELVDLLRQIADELKHRHP
ncbi:hypothetical protein A2797_00700 [candidate division WWE3 bacterium RIFCSPHIGHO2_01_FULL_48_15]|uniref:Uncharacterized protein n=1 Tax=candidate division WWE3 bacterium RIFCSPHIGHO2_01_FULL_48_15 TaxID=1802619 RepID=A0A1F4VBD7_UNCKA|nr:MAG: hypothetical protein A2797_00700 [candidate division WWE3 bacterium RIFCSPHIGHO2_01_FULL_48_15]